VTKIETRCAMNKDCSRVVRQTRQATNNDGLPH
jgi:hypothetical protein